MGFFGWMFAALTTFAATCSREKWLSDVAGVALMCLVFYFVLFTARTTAPRLLAMASWLSTAFAPLGRFIIAGIGLVVFLAALALAFTARSRTTEGATE